MVGSRFISHLEFTETSYILLMLSPFLSMVSMLTPLVVHPFAERIEDECLHSTFGQDRLLIFTTLIWSSFWIRLSLVIDCSPIPDTDIALYRFEDPAIPGFVLPPANLAVNMSPGDIQLNIDNPIVSRDGSDVPWGCNGDLVDYLGEDGEWYDYYTGSDGNLYNLTHVFYATNTTQLNVATIQRVWSPNLEGALYNRTVRLLISCTNQVDFEEGYIFFKTGDESFYIVCDSVPDLCSALNTTSSTTSGAWRQASGGASGTFIAVLAATVWFTATWILNYIH